MSEGQHDPFVDEETGEVRKPAWLTNLFTGELIDPSQPQRMPPPPPISVAQWRVQWFEAKRELQGGELHLERLQERVRELRELAMGRRDLRRELTQIEVDETPVPSRPVEPMLRVKVLQDFSTEYNGMLMYGYRNWVLDLPEGFVRRLSPSFVEYVGPEVEISTPPVIPR